MVNTHKHTQELQLVLIKCVLGANIISVLQRIMGKYWHNLRKKKKSEIFIISSHAFYLFLNVSFFFFFPIFGFPKAFGVPRPGIRSNLRCSCGNTRSFNPLCQARDRTCILALQRHHQYHCTTLGTLHLHFRSKITISHSWHVWVPECLLVLSTIHVTWTSNLAFVVQFWLHISNIFIPQYYCFQVWIYNLVIQIKHQTKFSNFYTYFNSLF